MKQKTLHAQAPRTALMKLFDNLAKKRVIYVHAPAGYGKTVSSLLWLEHRKTLGTSKHAWVNLDEYDNQASVFYKKLLTELTRLEPNNPLLTEFTGQPFSYVPSVELVLQVIGVGMGEDGERFLVFDDLHIINNIEILKLFPVFVKRMPLNCKILLLSRSMPPDCFAEMVAKDEMAFADAECLQFTGGEIKAFFDKNGQYITSRQAEEVLASTGGWAIGIRAVFLSGGKSYTVDYTSQYLEDYFKTHIWEQWDEKLRFFITAVSVADEITPRLCKALTGTSEASSAEILNKLVFKNYFIRKIGDDSYKFHDLFRDFLLRMFEKEHIKKKNAVYQKAGDWFYNQKNHLKAVKYYVKTDSTSCIAKALTLMYDYRSEHPVFEESIELLHLSLSDELLKDYPHLLELKVWLACMEGRYDDMLKYADLYHKSFRKIILKNPASLVTSILVHCFDPRKSLVKMAQKLSRLPFGFFNIEHTPPISQSFPFFHRAGRDFSEFLKEKDIEKHLLLLKKMLRVLAGKAIDMLDNTLRAGFAYERGEINRAYEYSLLAVSQMQPHFPAELQFNAYVIMASVLIAQGNIKGALKTTGEIETMIKYKKAYFLKANFNAFLYNIKLSGGDTAAAAEWLSVHAESAYNNLMFYKTYLHFTTVRAYIVAGNNNEAIIIAKKLLHLAENYNRPLDITEAFILLAIAYWKKGRGGHGQTAALEYLEQAAAIAHEYGYVQLFANYGADLLVMLNKLHKRFAQKSGEEGNLPYSFVKTLFIAAAAAAKLSKGLTGGSPPVNLNFTDKQKRVMSLMCEGHSRKEIAEIMGLKPDGVKSHTELIYKKLDVLNNLDAVLKIRELGLVDDRDISNPQK